MEFFVHLRYVVRAQLKNRLRFACFLQSQQDNVSTHVVSYGLLYNVTSSPLVSSPVVDEASAKLQFEPRWQILYHLKSATPLILWSLYPVR